MEASVSDGNEELSSFAREYPYCAMCWSRDGLHIHHLQQGAGRVHDRRALLRLCHWCHEGLHFGGKNNLTKGMCLTAKRECDDANYDPSFLASLRRKVHLGYGLERIPHRVLWFRAKRGIPQELTRMSINSRRKGKVGELEARDHWNRLLPKAHSRRSQQHSGTESASDLISPGTPNLWIEVKRVQRLNLDAVMEKSREQCGELVPVILHRKNDGQWMVTFPLEDIHRFTAQVNGAL
jgi:hypothetical protein